MGESALSDNEADDERDNLAGKAADIPSDLCENFKSKHDVNTVESLREGSNKTSSMSKNLTPKQVKLMEQRRKAREEKESKLQEEKLKKQQEKEEKELVRKREREEKKVQRRKEREEKEEQKRKERDEKERKRLAELEAKNEERRKKTEAKEEELRKKEDERKRKELEKEEAELKKKKAAQAFTKFFVAKTPSNAQIKNEEDSNTGDGSKLLAFRPFQVKDDMKIAPLCRKNFTTLEKNRLDDLLDRNNNANAGNGEKEEMEVAGHKPLPKSQLYLAELRSGNILPGKWRRPSTESKDDIIFVEDELERVGQEIVEDTPAYIREEMRVKFYKFHDNRRPPYYGTWRKKSSIVRPRKPLAQDKKFFDYEVDSDDEWEEEEPGESLEDGSDDDKEKESEDDDYEVDNEWFVPHGHLSDEELQNEDEFGMGDNTREAQKVKLQILQQEFAQEMKKKTEKIKPRLIGCIWVDKNGNQPMECAKILWDTLEKKAMLFTEPPLIEQPEEPTEPSSPPGIANGMSEKTKPTITLSNNMIKDLTRLVHGNNHSKNFLVNEYIAYVEKTEESVRSGDLRKPLKSVVRDKIEAMAEWQVVEANNGDNSPTATTLNTAITNTESTKKKKKGKKRLCWVVNQEMLNKMDLSSLKLQNSWKYILPPKFPKINNELNTVQPLHKNLATSTTPFVAEESCVKEKNSAATTEIGKFTKVLTSQKLQTPPATTTNTSLNDQFGAKLKTNAADRTAKEKKRVPLLMSVARGEHISTPAKNKLISQFLQQKIIDNNERSYSPTTSLASSTTRSQTRTSPQVEDDDVVILD